MQNKNDLRLALMSKRILLIHKIFLQGMHKIIMQYLLLIEAILLKNFK